VVLAAPLRPTGAQQSRDVILATTTSVRDAGLLDELLPAFERATRYRVKVIAVGSGQAMELGRRGDADLLILHDPAGEERFVAEGYGVDRRALMHNEFVLLGPPDNPASANGTDAVAAFRAIATTGARFVSRGDRSGTHAKEQVLWRLARRAPGPPWNVESGQGMAATLLVADQRRAYTLSDVATFLSMKIPLDLRVLVEGDTLLRNPYHVVRVNPARFDHLEAEGARALADYLLAPETQRAIWEFRRTELGRSVFIPDGNGGTDGR
jgi:tungstate transport system substrate-binding protein